MKAPANVYVVCASPDGRILMLDPPKAPMTQAEALGLAAWLVAVAEPHRVQKFAEILKAVRGVIP